jgi:hypothetical protein
MGSRILGALPFESVGWKKGKKEAAVLLATWKEK